MIRNDLDPLILDLLEWIGREPRSYADVIDAWRTSCPRLTVWEDAMDRGFALREHAKGREVMIRLTAEGLEFLREHGRIVSADTSPPSLPGLTRQSIVFDRLTRSVMDGRVKPAHDGSYVTPSRRRTPCGRRRGPAAAGSSCGRR